ncbi:MAG: PA0069 family radical SAM protein [Azospirillaceae bacterium]|nr:PA0069 family radical SAM protein [Azospirillaceae bacterium]
MDIRSPVLPHKGRGALGNIMSRFDREDRFAIDDGWGSSDDDGEARLPTTVTADTTRSLITRNTSPDLPFDRSINPYRGCEHGCIYCFARPSHGYLGLSPGLDFETRLFYKPDAAAILERELHAPGYRVGPLALGTGTDPYQPVERDLTLTRQLLTVLSAFNHPVGIATKSNLVLRDLDIIAPMAARGLAQVYLSVTTLDRSLARTMEPRAPTPERRLEAIRRLSAAGVPVAVLAAPMIPGLNDHELEQILDAAKQAGATGAGYILLRLPFELKSLFEDWLRQHYPSRADRVLTLLRGSRDGRLYRSGFGDRMIGTGAYAEVLAQRFRLGAKRLGLGGRFMGFAAEQFRPPPRPGEQLALF